MAQPEQQALLIPLLLIRRQREQLARREQARAHELRALREQETLQAQQALADFSAYRAAEEARLYAELQSRSVSPRSIDHYRSRVELLQLQRVKLDADIRDCQGRETLAEEALEVARRELLEAMRAVEKFEEVIDEFDVRAAKTAIVKEDAEIDEAAMTAWSLQRL